MHNGFKGLIISILEMLVTVLTWFFLKIILTYLCSSKNLRFPMIPSITSFKDPCEYHGPKVYFLLKTHHFHIQLKIKWDWLNQICHLDFIESTLLGAKVRDVMCSVVQLGSFENMDNGNGNVRYTMWRYPYPAVVGWLKITKSWSWQGPIWLTSERAPVEWRKNLHHIVVLLHIVGSRFGETVNFQCKIPRLFGSFLETALHFQRKLCASTPRWHVERSKILNFEAQ